MSLHNHNDALICKVFPSSLGPTALRWFNRLWKSSIHNFAELIQEFGIRFVTCSQVPQPVDVLLSMKMQVGETLRSYAGRYWELYNEIGGGNEKIATSTFRMGLPEDFGLRESLTKKPSKDMRQLMRRFEEYKQLEDDQLQNKGKAPMELQKGGGSAKDVVKVRILPDEDKYFQVGKGMKDQGKIEMLLFLIQNLDVFAWSPYEVPGVDSEFIVHRINVDPTFAPKK
nr:uncharacterized protein LOC112025560 [Quercus suber]